MKKDIDIPVVKDVHLAAVKVFNEQFEVYEWNVYLINDTNAPLEMVLIVSTGYDKKRETSLMRHKIEVLPAKNFAKIEYLQDEVLQLNNKFRITYFEGSRMMERTYVFKANTIKESALEHIPVIPEKGILAS